MPRAVLDTNVIVSALISEGKPRTLFRKGINGQFAMLTSEPLLKELARVLGRPKFRTSPSEIRRVTQALLNSTELVEIKSRLRVVTEDPKDDVVIETAMDGHADFIVTGDRHLLKLESFREIKIVTVEEALKLL
ncbi:MAG: putative toxin-antitoxin system toxin component, PIN family [Candidatus Bathyarchaeota archaeon]|nr:putative toxin-antitoxin system toxin component, PIN family [Candidatus Bathyarchaeota archaeon]